MHIPKQFRGKFDAKSWKGIFVGYSANGYRIWNPQKNCISCSRDVIFVENSSGRYPDESEVVIPKEVDPVVVQDDEQEEELEADSLETSFNSADETLVNNNEESFDEEEVSRREIKPPKWHADFDMSYAGYAFNALSFVNDIPSSISELKKRDDWGQWQSAMDSEMQAMQKNDSWTLVKPPKGRKIISCKWVLK